MSQGHNDWKQGDKAMYRGQWAEVIGREGILVWIVVYGESRPKAVWPHGLTEAKDDEG